MTNPLIHYACYNQFRGISPSPIKESFVAKPAELLKRSCPDENHKNLRLICSSFTEYDLEIHPTAPSSAPAPSFLLSPSANSLVWALFGAYSHHHHVTIRPEHIWFSILSQLSFYINANAERLRSFFVSHQGQKELVVVPHAADIESADIGDLTLQLTKQIQASLNDPEMRDWALPDFSTTTEDDQAVAAIMLMGAMQTYFCYGIKMSCGFSSVTLLGEQRDYQRLLEKVEKIPSLGAEPAKFTELLRPVLRGFVKSFDRPNDSTGFWGSAVHQSNGSGTPILSGWVTVFALWDGKGKNLYKQNIGKRSGFCDNWTGIELDGVKFHAERISKLEEIYQKRCALKRWT